MDRTSGKTALSIAFPEHVAQIARLRHESEEFEEICQDFAAIAELLSASAEGDQVADLQATLAGLKQDIETALSRQSPGSV